MVNCMDRNMSAGERADVLTGLILSEVQESWTPVERHLFLSRLAKCLESLGWEPRQKLDDLKRPEPMSDMQARAFERERVPFGKYEGWMVREVPLSYWVSLTDPSNTIKAVRRYIGNPDVKRRIEQEGRRE